MLRKQWFALRGYETLVDPGEQQKRAETCAGCPYADPERDECSLCGCPIDAKTPLASESCPKQFWPAVRRKKQHYSE